MNLSASKIKLMSDAICVLGLDETNLIDIDIVPNQDQFKLSLSIPGEPNFDDKINALVEMGFLVNTHSNKSVYIYSN